MAQPSPSWQTVDLYGTWRNPDGTVPAGDYEASIPVRVVSATDEIIFRPGVFARGKLGAETGGMRISVPASDDPDISPHGWQVTVRVTFSSASGGGSETYVVDPYQSLAGEGINLRKVFPQGAGALPPREAVVIRGVPGGLATLDGNGVVPLAQLPSGLGGTGSGSGGSDGKSAYQLAQQQGYTGSLTQWLASLQGEDGDPGAPGKTAYQVARDGGYSGTETQWLASLKGTPGASAYQVARDGGYGGTQAQWLASLKGDPGDPGASAYQVWVAAGNTGTVAQYLASLKGAKGDPGDGSSGNVSSGQITDASTSGKTVLTGTPAQGRQALGAGTSDLALGTSSTTAKRGDYTPDVAGVTGLPAALDAKASRSDAPAAVGDVKRRTGVTASGTTITVPGAGFTSADVGKIVVVHHSTAAGVPARIASVQSATQATLTTNPGLALTGDPRHAATWGTDDAPAIQAALNAAAARGSSAVDPGDNQPVSTGRPTVTLPSLNEGAYMLGAPITVPDGVGFDVPGAHLVGAATDRDAPAVTFGRDNIVGRVWLDAMHGGGIVAGVNTKQVHFHADLVEVWHAKGAALRLRGYHHRVTTFWCKDAAGVTTAGIHHDGSSDDWVGEAYMVGPRAGAVVANANNVAYGHLRGDTVTADALLKVDNSRTVQVRGHAFIITTGALPDVVKVGSSGTGVSAGLDVDMTVTRTGGAVFNLANVESSRFVAHVSNRDAGQNWGQPVKTGVVYGAGLSNEYPVLVDLNLADDAIAPAAGTRFGVLDVRRPFGHVTYGDAVTETGRSVVNYSGAPAGTALPAVQVLVDRASRTLEARAPADSIAPFLVDGAGRIDWGPGGNVARDVGLYRDRANVLGVSGSIKPQALTDVQLTDALAVSRGAGALAYASDRGTVVISDGARWTTPGSGVPVYRVDPASYDDADLATALATVPASWTGLVAVKIAGS